MSNTLIIKAALEQYRASACSQKKFKIMGLLRFIVVGAAVGYGVNYITKKGPDGRSILDEFTENPPDWFEKAKKYAEDTVNQAVKTAKENVG